MTQREIEDLNAKLRSQVEILNGKDDYIRELLANNALLQAQLERKEAARVGEPLTFVYRNWRGEVAERKAIPLSVHFGSTKWHPVSQWLLRAFDVDKQAERDFAMADMLPAGAEAAHVEIGEPSAFDDCPEGLFLAEGGKFGLMTEYGTRDQDGYGFRQRDAYCVDTGEYFWGGTTNAQDRAKLIVRPVTLALAEKGRAE